MQLLNLSDEISFFIFLFYCIFKLNFNQDFGKYANTNCLFIQKTLLFIHKRSYFAGPKLTQNFTLLYCSVPSFFCNVQSFFIASFPSHFPFTNTTIIHPSDRSFLKRNQWVPPHHTVNRLIHMQFFFKKITRKILFYSLHNMNEF